MLYVPIVDPENDREQLLVTIICNGNFKHNIGKIP